MDQPSLSKAKWSYCDNTHASMRNIMGLEKGTQAENTSHDFDIKNRKRVILNTVKLVVQDYHELGISFQENDEVLAISVVKILNNNI